MSAGQRADEREGALNDPDARRVSDAVNARMRELERQTLESLTENESFLNWMGKYLMPVLFQDFPVTNGSQLAEFMGRRQILLQQAADMDSVSPGFVNRVLHVRAAFEKDLEITALNARKEKK